MNQTKIKSYNEGYLTAIKDVLEMFRNDDISFDEIYECLLDEVNRKEFRTLIVNNNAPDKFKQKEENRRKNTNTNVGIAKTNNIRNQYYKPIDRSKPIPKNYGKKLDSNDLGIDNIINNKGFTPYTTVIRNFNRKNKEGKTIYEK